MTRPIKGLFPALATAFDAQGNLDANLQKELVNRLLAQGADGFFVCGTTGEFPVLSLDEREHLLELVEHILGVGLRKEATDPRQEAFVARLRESLGEPKCDSKCKPLEFALRIAVWISNHLAQRRLP